MHFRKLKIPNLNKISLDKNKMLNIMLGIIIFFLCIGILFIAKDRIFDSPVPRKTNIEKNNAITQNDEKVKINNKYDISKIYPFYLEPVVSQAQTRAENKMNSLPAIPNYQPRPNIPTPIIPPTSRENFPNYQSKNETLVQGVFIGQDGKNMAILNDGSIVSEGDSYQDGRIAFIGGDGIKFENGKTIKYK